MIQIFINPARVERVLFVAESDLEEDFDFATWQTIRPFISQIDDLLRKIVEDLSARSSDDQADLRRDKSVDKAGR